MKRDGESIWILDNDATCVAFYKQSVGLSYDVRAFSSARELSRELSLGGQQFPHLLIVDPHHCQDSFAEVMASGRSDQNGLHWPDFLIVTHVDDLELMRFYLKTGARDYILKPLRPNELVAKVERALHQVHNREFQVLRNEIDGVAIPDLTFREYQILTVILQQPQRQVAREVLTSAIWNKVLSKHSTLDVHIFNLRRKIRRYGFDLLSRDQLVSLAVLH